MKPFFKGFGLAALVLLLVGAAATTQRYRGNFVGTFSGLGTGLTNAAGIGMTDPVTVGGLGTISYSNAAAYMLAGVATTNSKGDLTLEATTSWLQMIGSGETTGYKIMRFKNGAGSFELQRANDANSYLKTCFIVTNDVFAFGIPVNGIGITNIAAAGLAIGGTLPILNGAAITNLGAANLAPGGTITVLNGAAITNLSAANLAIGGILPVLDGGALTNVTASSTNALYATNDGFGVVLQMDAKAAITNASIVNTLMVAGLANTDPPVFIARGTAAQSTNAILNIQASGQNSLFAIGSQGAVFLATNLMANWPAAALTHGGAAFCNSNGTVYLLTSGPQSLTWAATNKIAP